MKLHELKAELESDATKRAEAQEKTIKELYSKIRDMRHEAKRREEIITKLFHRCAALSGMSLCSRCNYIDECFKLREKYIEESEVNNDGKRRKDFYI